MISSDNNFFKEKQSIDVKNVIEIRVLIDEFLYTIEIVLKRVEIIKTTFQGEGKKEKKKGIHFQCLLGIFYFF